MKYAVFIIPFIQSRLIFLTYFSVNVTQIIMEQQMATCEGSFFIEEDHKSVPELENSTELEYKPRR